MTTSSPTPTDDQFNDEIHDTIDGALAHARKVVAEVGPQSAVYELSLWALRESEKSADLAVLAAAVLVRLVQAEGQTQ